VDDNGARTLFFAATRGVPAEFAFDKNVALKLTTGNGKIFRSGEKLIAKGVTPSTRAALQIATKEGTLQIVLLSQEDSLALWKGQWQGRDRVFLTRAGLVLEGDKLRLTSAERDDLRVGVLPAPGAVAASGELVRPKANGVFQVFSPKRPKATSMKPAFELVQAAGPAREIPLGKISQPVAAAPEEADFAKAGVWKIKLPENIDLGLDPILRLSYVGDVARVSLNGKLLTDEFYNGHKFDVGLRRYAPDILTGDLRVAILPLRKGAPIYLAEEAKPRFGETNSVVELRGIEFVPRYQVELTGR
jgi:hypothetical protein